MKNRHSKPCSVCGIQVSPGEGTLEKADGAWVVTHDTPCPRHPSSRSRAQDMARGIASALETENASVAQLEKTVRLLARLMRTGWVVPEVCEEKILSCRATADLDRLSVEELMAVNLYQVPDQRPV